MSALIPTDVSESLLDNLSDAFSATIEAFLSDDPDLMADGLTMLQQRVILCNERISEYLGLPDQRI